MKLRHNQRNKSARVRGKGNGRLADLLASGWKIRAVPREKASEPPAR
jgi:hypothetical protein